MEEQPLARTDGCTFSSQVGWALPRLLDAAVESHTHHTRHVSSMLGFFHCVHSGIGLALFNDLGLQTFFLTVRVGAKCTHLCACVHVLVCSYEVCHSHLPVQITKKLTEMESWPTESQFAKGIVRKQFGYHSQPHACSFIGVE